MTYTNTQTQIGTHTVTSHSALFCRQPPDRQTVCLLLSHSVVVCESYLQACQEECNYI